MVIPLQYALTFFVLTPRLFSTLWHNSFLVMFFSCIVTLYWNCRNVVINYPTHTDIFVYHICLFSWLTRLLQEKYTMLVIIISFVQISRTCLVFMGLNTYLLTLSGEGLLFDFVSLIQYLLSFLSRANEGFNDSGKHHFVYYRNIRAKREALVALIKIMGNVHLL